MSGTLYNDRLLRAADAAAQGEWQERMIVPNAPALVVNYTNWRGETSERRILPRRAYYGSTEWHPEPQWLLEAWDVDKDALRVFAMAGMRPVA